MKLDRSERRALREIEMALADSDSRLNELFFSFTLQGLGSENARGAEDQGLAGATDRAGRTWWRYPGRKCGRGLAHPALGECFASWSP